MNDRSPIAPEPVRPAVKHWLGFLVSGGIAFVTDAAMLEGLIRIAGMHPLTARLLAIPCAITVGWLCHRTLTFSVAASATLAEYGRYVSSASVAALLNYSLYAAALMVWPGISPMGALVLATIVATFYSYTAMRYFVFKRSSRAHER